MISVHRRTITVITVVTSQIHHSVAFFGLAMRPAGILPVPRADCTISADLRRWHNGFHGRTILLRKRKRDPIGSIDPGTFTDTMIRELFLNSLYQRPIGASKTEPLVAQYDGPAPVMCDWDERALLFCDMSTFLRNPTLCYVEATTCAMQRPANEASACARCCHQRSLIDQRPLTGASR